MPNAKTIAIIIISSSMHASHDQRAEFLHQPLKNHQLPLLNPPDRSNQHRPTVSCWTSRMTFLSLYEIIYAIALDRVDALGRSFITLCYHLLQSCLLPFINIFDTAGPKLHKNITFFWVEICDCIWNHHEKRTQISTNMPSIGLWFIN